MVEGKTGEVCKNGLRRRELKRRERRSCEAGLRMFLFMFWVHPGVLFNDCWAGHGVSLVQNHKMEEASVWEWECLQHYTVINLWWLCIWTKVITIWDEGLHLYPGSGWKLRKREADGHTVRKQKQMRMDEVTEVRGEDLKCSKHSAPLPQCTGKAGLCVDFMSHEEPGCMCYRSPNLDTIFLKNMFLLSLKRHPGLCVFSCIGLIYLATSFSLSTSKQPIYSHPPPVHLSLTRGQVCPCVASANRKCIMDVTFLSISTTKVSYAPLFRVIMKVWATQKKMLEHRLNQKANVPAKMKVHFKSAWPCSPFVFRARPLPDPLMMSASNWQEFFCSWSDWSWQVNLVNVCICVCMYLCVYSSVRKKEIKK